MEFRYVNSGMHSGMHSGMANFDMVSGMEF